jgi:hypothetical protein
MSNNNNNNKFSLLSFFLLIKEFGLELTLLSVCVSSVCVCPSVCLPLKFRRLMRSPCCLCPPPNFCWETCEITVLSVWPLPSLLGNGPLLALWLRMCIPPIVGRQRIVVLSLCVCVCPLASFLGKETSVSVPNNFSRSLCGPCPTKGK